jgi:hypothetical protein
MVSADCGISLVAEIFAGLTKWLGQPTSGRHPKGVESYMCPIVSLVSDRESDSEVFISLENISIVLADLRRALPQLKNTLRRRWMVQTIEIENRIPRFRNPFDPSQIIVPAGIGLLITFGAAAAKAAGKEFGAVAGKEIAAYVRRWIRRLATKKTRTAIRSGRPTQRKSTPRSRS